ncbi:MAG: helix-hairpin-helix domain-containing protein [Paludibacteraceae bacterium]|nr:helix-hairpin-helix domain-containing protein [Paludibacteraceae bacterium]
MKRGIGYILLFCCFTEWAYAQSVEDIIVDIYEQVSEYGGDLENLTQDLTELYNNKINLNTATAEDLQQLRFLSDQQIDNILNYVNQHSMNSIYELQLVPGLRSYEIRDLSYFVKVEKSDEQAKIYPKEVFHYANHEITLRADARNIENYAGDPFYGNMRYRFNYKNQIKAGWTMQRGAGQAWKDMRYGGFIELNRIAPHLETLVVGNYQAQFGQGLVIGQELHTGKSSYILSTGNGAEGISKYGSVSDSYDYLHGIAATMVFKPVSVSVFYSLRQEKGLWHHVVGIHTGYRHKHLHIGLTALEEVYPADSTRTSFGLHARYKHGIWDGWCEAAATCNTTSNAVLPNERWGWGMIAGLRLTPINGVGLLTFYRYYSPTYHNRYAQAFAETSQVNDENGFYIGTEIKLIPRWRLAAYADGFHFAGTKYGIPYPSSGWDAMFQADWEVNSTMNMFWKIRSRRKGDTDYYTIRYQYNWTQGGWRLRTQADGSLTNTDENKVNWGFSVLQDIQYTFRQVPITLQLRLQGFDIRNWDNRVYIYENDVLYAYSQPAVYGRGGRCYLNMRYKIKDWLSVYLKMSETIYHPQWDKAAQPNRTDIHLLLKVNL